LRSFLDSVIKSQKTYVSVAQKKE